MPVGLSYSLIHVRCGTAVYGVNKSTITPRKEKKRQGKEGTSDMTIVS